MIKKTILLNSFILLSIFCISQENIKIMYYNILKYPAYSDRADTLKKIIQYTTPDIFIVNELKSAHGGNLILARALNTNGVTHYSQAVFQDANGLDTDNHLYYNSNKIGLVEQRNINANPRALSEYKVYYKDPNLSQTNDTNYIYIYACHLKAGNSGNSTPTEVQQRHSAAQALKNYLSNNNINKNVIVGGDMNIYTSSEPAYTEITTGGNLNLFDPIGQAGAWHNSYNYRNIHTQSTRSSSVNSPYAGGSKGGLDDRFDMIFVSNDIINGSQGVKYVNNSYKAVGQDGNRFNGSVNEGVNNSVPQDIANSLFYMSDHLPVLMEITVGGPVNIQEENSNIISKLYFNSNDKKLDVYFENNFNKLELEIYNLSGKIVYKKLYYNNSSISDYLSKIKAGMYIIKMNIDNSTPISAKIISY